LALTALLAYFRYMKKVWAGWISAASFLVAAVIVINGLQKTVRNMIRTRAGILGITMLAVLAVFYLSSAYLLIESKNYPPVLPETSRRSHRGMTAFGSGVTIKSRA
jgi:hypothetical protein